MRAKPTPIPLLCTLPSTPAASSAATSGATANVVERYGIPRTSPIVIEDGAGFAKKRLTDPQVIAVMVNALDQPAAVVPATTHHANERIRLDLGMVNGRAIIFDYVPRLEDLEFFDPDAWFGIRMPPDLRTLLIQQMGGR